MPPRGRWLDRRFSLLGGSLTAASALLIGVTLVVLMSTGAASARQSLFAELDDHYPVDLTVASTLESDAIPASAIADVEAVDGVARVIEVPSVAALVDDEYVVLRAPDPAEAATVLRDSDVLTHLDDDTIVVPTYRDEKLDGTVVSVVEDTSSRETAVPGDEADEAAAPVELTAVYTSLAGVDMMVTPATLARIAPNAPTSMLWVGLDPGADAATTALAVMDTVGDGGLVVESAASERQQYAKVIDSLLAVVVGLLGVAVVIALVGVANTLSLSVIERRRESATLRAIGMTRRQLRVMLAVEGMLIAGIGALLGAGMGLLYGWAGAAIVLGNAGGDMHLSVPWRDLLLVLVVALGAGLLASVLPGRAAARTSPVAALAVD